MGNFYVSDFIKRPQEDPFLTLSGGGIDFLLCSINVFKSCLSTYCKKTWTKYILPNINLMTFCCQA